MLEGKIEKAFHDITDRHSMLNINIDEEIYELQFSHTETKITCYLDINHILRFNGKINREKKEITDVSEIWVKIV